MKPYILDDASAVEHKRLDLMPKILEPWTFPAASTESQPTAVWCTGVPRQSDASLGAG